MEEMIELLKSQARVSTSLLKHLEAYQKILSEPATKAYQLGAFLDEIKKINENLPESKIRDMVFNWLEQQKSEVARYKDEFQFNFGRNLKELLSKQYIELKGQLPILRAGLFSIKVDFEIGSAVIYWGPEVEKIRTKIPLSPIEITKAIENLVSRLKGKTFDEKNLLQLIFQAYKRILLINNLSQGEKVLLLDVLNEVVLLNQSTDFKTDPSREKFREYSRINFSYDLFRLRQAGDLKIDDQKMRLYVATFDATVEKRKALWIPDNELGEGTYYSYLSFGNQ